MPYPFVTKPMRLPDAFEKEDVKVALRLFSGGNIGFGYIILDQFVLKCCAGYPQNLGHAYLVPVCLLICP